MVNLLKPLVSLICFIIMLNLSVRAESLKALDYYTEEFFPYNYSHQGELSGFSFELLELIYDHLGQPVPEVKILPWPRAYVMAQYQPNSVLFSTIKTTNRLSMFRWVCPINVSRAQLFGLLDSQLNITQLSDLNNIKIAVLRGQAIDGFLSKKGFEDSLVRVKSLEQASRLLALRRVQALAMVSQRNSMDMQSFKLLYSLFESEYCFAFNLAVEAAQVAIFSQALAAVQASPEYQKLYLKYFSQ